MPLMIAGGTVEVFRAPLRRPFVTALGSRADSAGVGVTVRLSDGTEGYGEASESIVLARLSARGMAGPLRRELSRLRGRRLDGLEPAVRGVWRRLSRMTPAAAALECALTEAWCRAHGADLWRWAGGAAESLETDLTLSAADPASTASAAAEALREGFHTLKLKVGTGPREDAARARAVRDASRRLGLNPKVILDGNQGLSASGALRLLDACARIGLNVVLLEQPLPRRSLKEMAALQRRSPVPVAADESVWSPEDALRVLEAGAAQVINVKVAKTGLAASLRIVSLARAAGAGLMIGCMRETARGLAASIQLACGTGAFSFIDLDSDLLLAPGGPPGGFLRKGPSVRLETRLKGGRQ